MKSKNIKIIAIAITIMLAVLATAFYLDKMSYYSAKNIQTNSEKKLSENENVQKVLYNNEIFEVPFKYYISADSKQLVLTNVENNVEFIIALQKNINFESLLNTKDQRITTYKNLNQDLDIRNAKTTVKTYNKVQFIITNNMKINNKIVYTSTSKTENGVYVTVTTSDHQISNSEEKELYSIVANAKKTSN